MNRDRKTCFWVHVESQSKAYSEEDFRGRMFHYFARSHEKYRLPVYPIALFPFDEPFQEQDNWYVVSFPDRLELNPDEDGVALGFHFSIYQSPCIVNAAQ